MLAFQLETKDYNVTAKRDTAGKTTFQKLDPVLPSNDNLPTSGTLIPLCPLKCHIDRIKKNIQNHSILDSKVGHIYNKLK